MTGAATTSTWTTQAAAKLNLTLEVLGKRGDGFHDLASVVVSMDLADQVRLRTGGSERRISYRDEAGRRVSIETGDDIIARAWEALDRHCAPPEGGAVEIVKRIPLTSGLGGGSTDAAAFLRLARAAWRLDLSDDALCALGAEVGSDVPACMVGGPAVIEGRGERVTPLELSESALAGWRVLLHRPTIPVPAAKTAAMYRSLRSSDWRSGEATRQLVDWMQLGRAPDQAQCVNSFDAPAREVMIGLTAAWRTMSAAAARALRETGEGTGGELPAPLLAGAGPTLFAIMPPEAASRAAALLGDAAGRTCAARPISRREATRIQQIESQA